MKYVVQKGDSLSAIARRLNVNMRSLAAFNKIKVVNKIFIGLNKDNLNNQKILRLIFLCFLEQQQQSQSVHQCILLKKETRLVKLLKQIT